MADIEKLLSKAVEKAKDLGATYADCRYVETIGESLSYSNGAPDSVSHFNDSGFGIRVIADGSWGFYGSALINEKEVMRCANLAVGIARASAIVNKARLEISPVAPQKAEFSSKYKIDPFTISLSEKLAFLSHLDELMGKNSQINTKNSDIDFRKINSVFVSSDESKISQKLIHSGIGIELGVRKSMRERATRSFPQNGGQYETKGYELLNEYDFESEIPRLSEEAISLMTAPECPSLTTNVLLEGSVVGLVIHELIGHPLELDRVFGSERNFSGTSFATPEKLGNLQYGSALINAVNDPTQAYGLGSFGFDDEGIAAHRTELIKNGILTGYLSSRETASKISANSSGCMRADGWGNLPLVRMTNTLLLPGDKSFDDLLSMAGDGLYLSTISSWSPSDDRSSFEFGCEIAFEIKGGKIGQIYKNPTFSGQTIEFWNSVAAIGNESLGKVWGTPNCGKGQPGQNARTGQGASPILVTNLKVGS